MIKFLIFFLLDERNSQNDGSLYELEQDFKNFKNEINEKITNFDMRQEAQLDSIKAILEGISGRKQVDVESIIIIKY